MVTGIETAGLVLGAFPMVIEGLRLYIKGISTMRDMKRYEFILGQFKRDIEMESTHFEDTCYQLLQHMVLPETVTLDNLIANPGSNLWKAEELQDALRHRLRPGSAQKFMDTANELKRIMYILGERFDPSKSLDSCDEKAHRKAMKKFRRMLDAAFGKDFRVQQLERIRQLNKDLRLLVTGMHVTDLELTLVPTIPHGTNPASKYQRIKTHATAVYDLMHEKFQSSKCGCKASHTASLQLQVRSIGAPGPIDQSLRFQLVFDSLMRPEALEWREVEFECLDVPPPPTQIMIQQNLESRQGGSSNQAKIEQVPSPAVPMCFNFTSSSADAIAIQGTLEKYDRPLFFAVRHLAKVHIPLHSTEAGLDFHAGSLTVAIRSKSGEKIKQALQQKMRFLAAPRDTGQSTSRPVSPGIPGESAVERRYSQQQSWSLNETQGGRECTASNLGIIGCLCSEIKATHGRGCHSASCLGLLISANGNLRHKLWLPKRSWLSFQPESHVTLGDLFASSLPTPSTKLRLKLALKLASTVLQLHDSCWLDESWGRGDIHFVQGPDGPVIDKPLVYRVFPRKSSQPGEMPSNTAQGASEWPLLCNRSIFCLGIILIELWHWKSMSQLQRAPVGCENLPLGDLILSAQRMIPELYDTAGVAYGAAVQGCIMGWPSTRKPEPCLELEGFKNDVYRMIVYPLENHLKHFCNERNLEKIFD